jgi:hypothetical protein
MGMSEILAARFWDKVKKGGPDECWPFQGKRHRQGYGLLNRSGRQTTAHRVAWELSFGPIPSGLQGLHHCDNPPCCNPGHLFLGTPADNMEDARRKGKFNPTLNPRMRLPQLWKKGHAPLGPRRFPPSSIRKIRSSQQSQRTLARRWGVSAMTIYAIQKRHIYKDVL